MLYSTSDGNPAHVRLELYPREELQFMRDAYSLIFSEGSSVSWGRGSIGTSGPSRRTPSEGPSAPLSNLDEETMMDERSDEDIAFAIFKLDERIASLERNRSSELSLDTRAELRGRMGRKEPE